MRAVLLCHSPRSDWNHGNAPSSRGVVTEPVERGAGLRQVDGPRNAWRLEHLRAEHGRRMILARHTCAHRVEELHGFCRELGVETGSLEPVAQERVTA
ncbi:glycosyltransferase [Archangium sp.]|uniref:glycosyltransferase n=1 Tax=Archangium sp. TaxID=1872627 RepID=UPI002EDAC7CB